MIYFQEKFYRDEDDLIESFFLNLDQEELEEYPEKIVYTKCVPQYLNWYSVEELKNHLERYKGIHVDVITDNVLYDLTYLCEEDISAEFKGLDIFSSYCQIIEFVWKLTGVYLYSLAWIALKIVSSLNKHIFVWVSEGGKKAQFNKSDILD